MELELLDMEEDLLVTYFMRREQQLKRRRRWSVRPLNKLRPRTGEYASLVRPLRDVDEEMHFAYFHMSAGRFDDLLRRVEPHIRHQGKHSMPVDAVQRLTSCGNDVVSGRITAKGYL